MTTALVTFSGEVFLLNQVDTRLTSRSCGRAENKAPGVRVRLSVYMIEIRATEAVVTAAAV